MGQTRMFRDRVVSMEQTLEGGEKHLALLKELCREALPDLEYREHMLDHERDLFVLEMEGPDGARKRVAWTRMVLFDAERIPTMAADATSALRAKIVDFIRAHAAKPEILVTFRHLEEGWVDTPEPKRDGGRRRRRGGRGRGSERGTGGGAPDRRPQQQQQQQQQQPRGQGGRGPQGQRGPRGGAPGQGGGGRGGPAPARAPQPAASAGAPQGQGGGEAGGAGKRRRRFRKRRRGGGGPQSGGAPPAGAPSSGGGGSGGGPRP
jgi:hypothetical protein